MASQKYYQLIFQTIFVYGFIFAIYSILRFGYIDPSGTKNILTVFLIFVYILILYFFITREKFLPLLKTDSILIKNNSILRDLNIKLKRENNKLKIKLKETEGAIANLEQDLKSHIQRSKGNYKTGVVFNSEDEEKLNEKTVEMLKNPKGELIRFVGLMDGTNRTLIKAAAKKKRLKLITRGVERDRGGKIMKFYKSLNKEYGLKIKESNNVHGRMLIIGNGELLITTTDLVESTGTRSDFGIWTKDKIMVQQAINCFERIYESENTKDVNLNSEKKK